MSGLLSNIFKFASRSIQQQMIGFRQFHALPTSASSGVTTPSVTNPWSLSSVRTIVRNNFPKARETKRVKTLGWKARLSTRAGRRVIMRRILKGRFVLSH